MPTYPETSSHLNNFTRADGTTKVHSDDHSRVIDLTVNAKRYLKGNGTTENQTDIDAFAADCAGKKGYFPPGTYVWPDAGSLTLSSFNTVIEGAGREATIITVKNAYAFKTPTTGSLDRVRISDMSITVRSGATSGGGVKAVSNSYHSGWMLRDLLVSGVTGSTDPLLWLDGWLGSHVDGCIVQNGGGHQIFVDGTGFISNAYSVTRCGITGLGTTTGATTAGAKLTGSNVVVSNNVFEHLWGYGIWFPAINYATVQGNWFENNGNHNVLATDAYGVNIIGGNKFHAHASGASADHISLTRSAATNRDCHVIVGNAFQDDASSGVNLRIGTNVEYTYVAANRRGDVQGGRIVDNGTGSTIIAGDFGDAARFPYWIDIPETTGISFAAANHARIWARDDGTGKTQIMATFSSGANQVIATQA